MDIYQRYVSPHASQARIISIGRLSLVGFSMAAYILALTVPGLLVTIGIAALAGTAQLIIPTLGAITWRRAHPVAAFWGLTGGILCVLVLTYGASVSNPLGLHAGIWGLLLNSLIFISFSLLLKRRDHNVVERFVTARHEYTAEYHPEQLEDDARPVGEAVHTS